VLYPCPKRKGGGPWTNETQVKQVFDDETKGGGGGGSSGCNPKQSIEEKSRGWTYQKLQQRGRGGWESKERRRDSVRKAAKRGDNPGRVSLNKSLEEKEKKVCCRGEKAGLRRVTQEVKNQKTTSD